MDAKIEQGNPFKYTCIVDAVYQLALYLLQCKDDDIKETFFFIGNNISSDIYYKLPNYKCCKITSIYGFVLFKCLASIKWRFRYKTTIFALDHCWLSYALIGNHDYTYIEDAPCIFSRCSKLIKQSPNEIKRDPLFIHAPLWKRFLGKLILGPLFGKTPGRNEQCVNRIITTIEDAQCDLLENKVYALLDTSELWGKASIDKKEYIKDLFGITGELIDNCDKSKVILLTDPMMEDYNYTEEQVFELYKPYIEKYASDGIVIKTHNRDKFNYQHFFPTVSVLNTKVPMQLLSLMGIKFDVAITPLSSAIYGMPETTKIIRIIE